MPPLYGLSRRIVNPQHLRRLRQYRGRNGHQPPLGLREDLQQNRTNPEKALAIRTSIHSVSIDVVDQKIELLAHYNGDQVLPWYPRAGLTSSMENVSGS